MQRELLFDLGVAYGIDCLLIDPTLGGRCDTFTTFDVSVSPENTTVERDPWANKQPLWPGVDPAVKTQRAGPQRTREPGDQEATGQGFSDSPSTSIYSVPYRPGPFSFIHPPVHPLTIKWAAVGDQQYALFCQSFSNHPSAQSFTYPFNKQFLSLCQNKPGETAMFDRVWLPKWPWHMVLLSNVCGPYFRSLAQALTLVEPLSWALHCVRRVCISHAFIHAVPFIECDPWAYYLAQCPSYPYPIIEAVIINSIMSIWKLSLKEMKWLKWQSLWPVDFYTRWLIGIQ